MKRLLLKIWKRDPILLELFLGVEAAIFGLVLAYPNDTFSSSTSFTFLKAFGHETLIGCIILIITILYFLAIICDNKHFRMVGLFAIIGFWGFIATGFYISNPIGTAWPVYTGFAAGALYCILNLDGYRL